MMIRDTGGWVEFWFQTGSTTFNHEQGWGYQVGGGGFVAGQFDLARGGAWQKFGAVYIGSGANQNVLFRINSSGLGWPTTDFTVTVQRVSIPPAPNWVSVAATSSTTAHLHFASAGDGGSPVLEWQLGYGLDARGPQYYAASGGISDLTGLVSGATYYFWARGRNAYGWSAWSARAAVTLWRIPDAPNAVAFRDVGQSSLTSQFTFDGKSEGGRPVEEWQTGYGIDPDTPQTLVSNYLLTLKDLLPGRTYYFWARARNSIGWGPWSVRSEVHLTAGAFVNVVGDWKRALPWVRTGGVWKIGRPNVPVNGVWKVPTS